MSLSVKGRHDVVLEEVKSNRPSPSPRYPLTNFGRRTPSPNGATQSRFFPSNSQRAGKKQHPQHPSSLRYNPSNMSTEDFSIDECDREGLLRMVEEQQKEYYESSGKMKGVRTGGPPDEPQTDNGASARVDTHPSQPPCQLHPHSQSLPQSRSHPPRCASPEMTLNEPSLHSLSHHSDVSDLTSIETHSIAPVPPTVASNSGALISDVHTSQCTVLARDGLGRLYLSGDNVTADELKNAIQLMHQELSRKEALILGSGAAGSGGAALGGGYGRTGLSQPSGGGMASSKTPSPTNSAFTVSRRGDSSGFHRRAGTPSFSVSSPVSSSLSVSSNKTSAQYGVGNHSYLQQTISSAAKSEGSGKLDVRGKSRSRSGSAQKHRGTAAANGSRGSSRRPSPSPVPSPSPSPSSLPFSCEDHDSFHPLPLSGPGRKDRRSSSLSESNGYGWEGSSDGDGGSGSLSPPSPLNAAGGMGGGMGQRASPRGMGGSPKLSSRHSRPSSRLGYSGGATQMNSSQELRRGAALDLDSYFSSSQSGGGPEREMRYPEVSEQGIVDRDRGVSRTGRGPGKKGTTRRCKTPPESSVRYRSGEKNKPRVVVRTRRDSPDCLYHSHAHETPYIACAPPPPPAPTTAPSNPPSHSSAFLSSSHPPPPPPSSSSSCLSLAASASNFSDANRFTSKHEKDKEREKFPSAYTAFDETSVGSLCSSESPQQWRVSSRSAFDDRSHSQSEDSQSQLAEELSQVAL